MQIREYLKQASDLKKQLLQVSGGSGDNRQNYQQLTKINSLVGHLREQEEEYMSLLSQLLVRFCSLLVICKSERNISEKIVFTHYCMVSKLSTTYAIVSFFSPDLSMKFSNFSKTLHHKFLHSHSKPKGAPVCIMASKSYDWDVRNISKISPKTVIFRLFSIFSKTVHAIRAKFSTVILHHIRALRLQ